MKYFNLIIGFFLLLITGSGNAGRTQNYEFTNSKFVVACDGKEFCSIILPAQNEDDYCVQWRVPMRYDKYGIFDNRDKLEYFKWLAPKNNGGCENRYFFQTNSEDEKSDIWFLKAIAQIKKGVIPVLYYDRNIHEYVPLNTESMQFLKCLKSKDGVFIYRVDHNYDEVSRGLFGGCGKDFNLYIMRDESQAMIAANVQIQEPWSK